jgi:hypothetical protein
MLNPEAVVLTPVNTIGRVANNIQDIDYLIF